MELDKRASLCYRAKIGGCLEAKRWIKVDCDSRMGFAILGECNEKRLATEAKRVHDARLPAYGDCSRVLGRLVPNAGSQVVIATSLKRFIFSPRWIKSGSRGLDI